MKKYLIIIMCIILSCAVLFGIWWLDNTRTIEKMTNYSSASKYAYSLSETNNEIKLTIYAYGEELVKTVTIYQLDNSNKVNNIVYERHYENKLQANTHLKSDEGNMDNAKVENNVVVGTLNTRTIDNMGQSKADLLNEFNKYKDIWTEIK